MDGVRPKVYLDDPGVDSEYHSIFDDINIKEELRISENGVEWVKQQTINRFFEIFGVNPKFGEIFDFIEA